MLIVSQQVKSVRSGVGTYARVLLEGLCERGVRPVVATWRDERDPALDVDWLDLGARPRFDPTPGQFWSLGKRVAGIAPDFELVHFLDAREAHAYTGTGRLIGTVHDDYALHAPRTPWGLCGRASDPLRRFAYYAWLRRLERRTYPRFDLLLANSQATAASVVAGYDLDAARVQTIPLCVLDAPAGEPEALAGSPSLLFVGGNYYRKGLDTLVHACALAKAEQPDLRVHVVGQDPAQGHIQEVADLTEVGITFHGRVSPGRVAAMMAGADLFVMPSRREALGLVYLEAARAGTPVIAGNRGGVEDIVRAGETGLAVPPEDPEALADAILTLTDDADLRARLVAGAREELQSRTPWRLVDETVSAYGVVKKEAEGWRLKAGG